MSNLRSIFFNCQSSGLRSTLGVISFHRLLLEELAKSISVFLVSDRAAQGQFGNLTPTWSFVTEIVSAERARELLYAERSLEGTIELCAHHFQPKELPIKTVTFVFDLHCFDIPWKYTNALRERLVKSVLSSDAVITMFPRTYFDIEGVIEHRITQLFLTESPLLVKPERSSEITRKKTDTPILIYPAQLQIHKNHAGLLLGLRRYLDLGRKSVNLVLTGSDFLQSNLRSDLERMIVELDLRTHVRLAGHVDEPTLRGLYEEAAGMLVGSLAEGGGYVPL